MSNTKSSLGIFYYTAQGHEEVEGLSFFSYWPDSFNKNMDCTELYSMWGINSIKTEFCSSEYDGKKIVTVNVRIRKWPTSEQWLELIERSMRYFIDNGALVAWCGGYDGSPSIDVFDPSKASGNVYAAYSIKSGFLCNAALNDEYKSLTDNQLLKIKTDHDL